MANISCHWLCGKYWMESKESKGRHQRTERQPEKEERLDLYLSRSLAMLMTRKKGEPSGQGAD